RDWSSDVCSSDLTGPGGTWPPRVVDYSQAEQRCRRNTLGTLGGRIPDDVPDIGSRIRVHGLDDLAQLLRALEDIGKRRKIGIGIVPGRRGEFPKPLRVGQVRQRLLEIRQRHVGSREEGFTPILGDRSDADRKEQAEYRREDERAECLTYRASGHWENSLVRF